MAVDSRLATFGTELWTKLLNQPYGSLGKRELELAILDAATKSGLVLETPDALASALSLSLTKANSYLTDLALRRPALSDADGHTLLAELLTKAEILPDQRHLSFAMHNPALKIWLDRKLASNQSHHGDGIRSNIAKLSPATLLSLLAISDAKLQDPAAVFKQLQDKLGAQPWITDARKQISSKTTWQQVKDAVDAGKLVIGLSQVIPALYQLAVR
jgi:hypothetical protein